MSRKSDTSPRAAALLSVSPWRNQSTGEENGDVVVAVDIDERIVRLRLSDADAQQLADAIGPIRSGIAARRRAGVARRRQIQIETMGADRADDELRVGSDPARREGERTQLPLA